MKFGTAPGPGGWQPRTRAPWKERVEMSPNERALITRVTSRDGTEIAFWDKRGCQRVWSAGVP